MQLRLTRNEWDCPKMYDPAWAGYFLHNKDGSYLNTTAPFSPVWMGCDTTFPDAKYPSSTTQYYLDWRNESARNWWLDVQLGSIINSTVVDGFYWDDPVFGNEGTSLSGPISTILTVLSWFAWAYIGVGRCPFLFALKIGRYRAHLTFLRPFFPSSGMFIREGFTAAELADIDQHMQATRLEGYKRLSRGGGFCTGSTCYTAVPDVADCTCGGASHLDSNCTCDYSPEVVIRNVQTAQGQSDSAVLVQQPYPYEFHSPDGGPYQVGCGGPAVVQSTESDPTRVPHSVQLSCLPGTGTMTVDFASFGLPAIGGNTPAVRPGTGIRTANCSSFVTNSSCDAGPAVLKQLKALCDGKQSCRLNTSHPVFTRPTSGACGDVPLSDLKLAVRATGCQFGTGSGVVFNFRERLAMFLLARGDHWWMGTGWIANYAPVMLPEWEVDYGTPEGNLTVGADGVITRRWSKMDVSLDTNTFEATFEPRSERGGA